MANINQLVQEAVAGGQVIEKALAKLRGDNNRLMMPAVDRDDTGNFLTYAGNKILANDRELTAKFIEGMNKTNSDVAIGTRQLYSDIGEKAMEIGGKSARALQRLYASLKDQLPSGTTEKEGLGMVKFLSDMTPTQTGIAAGLGTLGTGYAVKKYLQRPKTSAMRGRR